MRDLPVAIHIVDDSPMHVELLQHMLAETGYALVTHTSPSSFLSAYHRSGPTGLIADLVMPGLSGEELIRMVLGRGDPIACMAVSGSANVPTTVSVMRAGAMLVLEKSASHERLVASAHELAREAVIMWREHERSTVARQRLDQLTPRERDVAAEIVAGKPNKVIAFELGISIKTVEQHRCNIMRKTGADSVASLVRLVVHAHLDPRCGIGACERR
jgi:two-component system response regulator FixJ